MFANSRLPRDILIEILVTRPFHRLALASLSATAACCGILAAFFQKAFIDQVTGHEVAFLDWSPHPLVWLGLSFLALLLSLTLAQGSNALGMSEAIWMQRRLSERLYRTVLRLQPHQLNGKSVGEVVATYTTDVPSSTILLDQSLPQGFNILFPMILAPTALILYFSLPAGPVLFTMLALIVVNFFLARRQSAFFSRFKQLAAERIGFANEWIQNIRTLRILGWTEKFEDKIFSVRKVETKNRLRMLTNGQGMNAIAANVTFILNVLFISLLASTSPTALTPGTLMALLWIVAVFLTRPFRLLPWFFTFVFDAWTSIQRLSQYLSIEPQPPTFLVTEEKMDQNNVKSRDLNMAIQIEHLDLSLSGQKVLQDISLSIRSGEFVALVGEVGSGKTQLLLSMIGETPATFGRFRVMGLDVSRRNLQNVRLHFGFVPQEGFVISGSLGENVRFDYNLPSPAMEADVQTALLASSLDPDVELGHGGLSTEIGERGVNLSGGQRQRVSLARLCFHDPEILLFDDCFSALDVNTEDQLIKELFLDRWREKTRILATHRLTVLPRVDRIFFLQSGKIMAVGTWSQLLETNTAFKEYARSVAAVGTHVS